MSPTPVFTLSPMQSLRRKPAADLAFQPTLPVAIGALLLGSAVAGLATLYLSTAPRAHVPQELEETEFALGMDQRRHWN